ncbi:endonuclease/exonuclease/phosphatase family protein [Jannaschia formosa]|uniref:endonuclease/exonuclease/phosphatase family protein n=1 Tax=Jannaschia formosa TaxID=2259592 RepID=UPI000E1BEE22|nr:endonuclease/exonuclease/phosphatase family protein [Jannaschia formosa]TFL20138.1 endonuclease [Jannaschia formosa]
MRLLRPILLALGLLALLAACVTGVQHLRLGGEAAGTPVAAGGLRLASHNVHYIDLTAEGGRWSRAGWERRRGALDAAFKALGADIVAFQEMESFAGGSMSRENLALDWLLARNPGFAAAATGDPAAFPSTQPILYRRDRFTVEDQGWFFFSETPAAIYARGFDGAPPSFASWARLRDRQGGAALTVINVHFDWGSWENRRRSAGLVADFAADRIAEGARVVLTGDLNARAGSPTLAILEEAGLAFPPVPGATVHFDRGLNLFGAIDHIGLGPGVAPVSGPQVLRGRFEGAFPSDHYPVALDVRIE